MHGGYTKLANTRFGGKGKGEGFKKMRRKDKIPG